MAQQLAVTSHPREGQGQDGGSGAYWSRAQPPSFFSKKRSA
jgi:hypothetical protein